MISSNVFVWPGRAHRNALPPNASDGDLAAFKRLIYGILSQLRARHLAGLPKRSWQRY